MSIKDIEPISLKCQELFKSNAAKYCTNHEKSFCRFCYKNDNIEDHEDCKVIKKEKFDKYMFKKHKKVLEELRTFTSNDNVVVANVKGKFESEEINKKIDKLWKNQQIIKIAN
jgi:hypothetical protein